MNDISFKDCEYRRVTEAGKLYCKNKEAPENNCDNCKSNIHLNCTNYNPKRDMCLKWFEEGVSRLKECKEKTTFNDNDLQKKWSN